MTPLDSEFAPAKLNLALHVRARRDDGYHVLETVFAFVDIGDRVFLMSEDGVSDRIEITGSYAKELSRERNNLIALARNRFREESGIAEPFHLSIEKNLPIASGLGGGSADAAATLRLLNRHFGSPLDHPALMRIAGSLGTDVPACLIGQTAIGRGRGDVIEPTESDLAGAPVILVNPNIRVSTARVFSAWDGVDHGALPLGSVRTILERGRNDLQACAIDACPQIRSVLTAIDAHGALTSRMSGSGASCYGLFDSPAARDRAVAAIKIEHPDWWVRGATLL